MKKMNNKGFSLVELIVVIAIMAVLVGVLAPQFIKYVESSRRSTDISNAQNIQSAVLADIAEGSITDSTPGTGFTPSVGTPTALGEVPLVKGNKVATAQGNNAWTVNYNAASGTCSVFISTYELTSTSGASEYKEP